jgi:hypothetical protein
MVEEAMSVAASGHPKVRRYSVPGTSERYRCGRCKRLLEREEIFNEPFTCAPDRYTRCCMRGNQFTGVIVEEVA